MIYYNIDALIPLHGVKFPWIGKHHQKNFAVWVSPHDFITNHDDDSKRLTNRPATKKEERLFRVMIKLNKI